MSGKEDYVNQKISQQISTLEKLSAKLLVDKININPEAEKYLSLHEQSLEKMTASELSVGEYILSAHSLMVQRTISRASAIKGWANKCIESLIAKNYNAEAMIKYEIRKAQIALNDEYAKRLSEIISEQEMVIDELAYLAQSINSISNSLGNLARIRSKNHEYSNR